MSDVVEVGVINRLIWRSSKKKKEWKLGGGEGRGGEGRKTESQTAICDAIHSDFFFFYNTWNTFLVQDLIPSFEIRLGFNFF